MLNELFLSLEASEIIRDELEKAQDKFPGFADDLFQAVALLGEEYGETCMAVNDFCYDGKPIEQVITEAAQTAAVANRVICMALQIKEAQHVRF